MRHFKNEELKGHALLFDGPLDLVKHAKEANEKRPFNVALVSNLDLAGGHRCNPSGVWFRSACCIAVADMLESMGYSVEIWTWTLGSSVYPKPHHNQFIACCPKKAGAPVDYDALVDTMSAWFTTQATFGAFAANPEVFPESYGYAVECKYDSTSLEGTGIGKWAKYLDLEQGTVPVCVPMAVGSAIEDGLNMAAVQAKKVLEAIIKAQE